jgi:uncharacterized protein Yka (UPF0111/DUF47 family)
MSEPSEINNRFDRIETKLDKLSEAMVSLARTEEKIMSMENDRANQMQRMNRFSEKLDNIEKKCDDNARTVSTINKLFWVVIVAVVGVMVQQYMS